MNKEITTMKATDKAPKLNPKLDQFIAERLNEKKEISEERKAELKEVADFLKDKVKKKEEIRLLFVCTHNSRRSQIAQVWAHTAAAWFGVEGVKSYSGGTEATAFNHRAINSLSRCGFIFNTVEEGENPIYEMEIGGKKEEYKKLTNLFSKVYTEDPNPKTGFVALMVCSEADKGCPIVNGAEMRVSLPYIDPKYSDGTADEKKVYDDKCRQIAREMLYLMELVKAKQK